MVKLRGQPSNYRPTDGFLKASGRYISWKNVNLSPRFAPANWCSAIDVAYRIGTRSAHPIKKAVRIF
jgi:hypothetical protein